MKVYQVPVGLDTGLIRLNEVLRVIRPEDLPLPRHEMGDIDADLVAGPPEYDRDVNAPRFAAHLSDLQAATEVPPPLLVRAAWYYPAGGGLGWHTNSMKPGWRAYVVRSLAERPDAGVMTSSGVYPDVPGMVNLFRIDPDWRRSWHAVYARTPRLSIGVWAPDDWAIDILAASGQVPTF